MIIVSLNESYAKYKQRLILFLFLYQKIERKVEVHLSFIFIQYEELERYVETYSL